MKKWYKNKKIIFPCLACVTAVAFATPVLCVLADSHVSMDYRKQRWAKIVENVDYFDYEFKLDEELLPNQNLHISLKETPLYEDRPCLTELVGGPAIEGTIIHQTIKLYRKDGNPLEYFDAGFFDIKFVLTDINNEKKVYWSDEIQSLRLRFEYEGD